jgi:hypothetical protein
MGLRPDLMEYIKRAALGTAPEAPPVATPAAPAPEPAVELPFSQHEKKTSTKAHKATETDGKQSGGKSFTEAAPEYRTAVNAYNQAAATQELTPEKQAGLEDETRQAAMADRMTDYTRGMGLATAAMAKGATDGKLDYSNDWNSMKSNSMDRLKDKRGMDEQVVKSWLKNKMDAADLSKGVSSKTTTSNSSNDTHKTNTTDTTTEVSDVTGNKSGIAKPTDPYGSTAGIRANDDLFKKLGINHINNSRTVDSLMNGSLAKGVGIVQDQIPMWVNSQQGAKTRMALQGVWNDILSSESGKTITPDEAKRYMAAFGGKGTPEDIRAGLELMQRKLHEQRNMAFSTTHPMATKNFIEHNPDMSLGKGYDPQFSTDKANPQSQMVTVSNGKETLQIPLSDVAAAGREGFKQVQ